MYIPEMFHESDAAEIEALMDRYSLAIVVAFPEDGLTAHHLPLLRDGADRLIGHVARANPLHSQLEDGAEILAIFRGEEAYISPNWYPSKPEHHRHV
ncbi:MAG: FMN-binding negative transcriptional regulator, partial [Alphaproteobacteria bacterium]|nr:FMN-binding negative transcriptional regulator [Alphaproteobacteria bacterium]